MDRSKLISIGIFLISFVIFVITLSPTVSFTDSGELAGVAYSLGVAHSSGYPLLAIISHLWTILPTGWTVIYQLNILSAIFAASSAVVFYFTLKLLLNNFDIVQNSYSIQGKKAKKQKGENVVTILQTSLKNSPIIEIIAASVSLGFAFSSLVWEQAVVFEVYSLQFLLINLTLFFLFQGIIHNNDSKKYFILSALFVGFSFSNHLTTILIIPAIFFIFFKKPGNSFNFSQNNIKQFLFLLIFVLIGLSFYIYLPLRSMAEPDFNWGYVHRGFDKFLYHVQGKQYQVWMFSGTDVAFENLGKFLSKVPYNLGFIGLIPFFAGIFRLYKSYREYFWFFIILTITCILYSVNYSIHDIDVYFYLAIYAFLLFTATGLLYIAENFKKLQYIAIIFPLLNIAVNFGENDKSDNYLVYDYTRNVVDNLGENAIIISAQWDYWNSAFWYLQKVENYRPDIILIERELMRRTWYPLQLEKWHPEIVEGCRSNLELFLADLEKFESGLKEDKYPNIQRNYVNLLKCFIESNIDSRPIYVTFDYMNSGADAEPLKGYNIVPAGFAFKLERIEKPFKVSIDNLLLDRFIKYPKDSKSHLEKGIIEISSLNLTNIGRYAAATGDFETAKNAYNKALEIYPDNDAARRYLLELR